MKHRYKKITAILLIVSFYFLVKPNTVRADSWGANMASAIWGQTTEQMMTKIKESVVASAKITAIRIIQGRLNVLLTGSCGKYCIGGSGSAFITDWQDFIFGSAQREADRVTSSFFSGVRSKTTAAMQRVVINAEKALDNEVERTKGPDLQNYVAEGKGALIFDPSTSNPKKAWMVAAQPQNDAGYMYLQGLALKQETYRQQEELRKTKATAYQGFKGTETNKGKTSGSGKNEEETLMSLPGSIVKDITAEVQSMGMKMLEFAKSIPEVVAGMINQTLTNLINYGIRQITDPIDQQINNFRNKVGTQVWKAQNDVQRGVRETIYFNKKR